MKEINLKHLPKIAQDLLIKSKKIKSENATIITLSGDLGSGKTTLTQEFAKILGVKENIVSPTFVIMKRYEVDSKDFKDLIHIDAYRLDNKEELMKIGWEEIYSNKDNLIIIEWPERVAGLINDNHIHIELAHIDENTRSINWED